jgi:uncharacterized coiled-coil DUF342 family protein
MQHGSPHFGASEGFACIPGIRRQRDEARERAERLDVQLQDTQSDYGALEAERDELRAEVARLREDVIRWANEFEARHGVYPEITAAADDLRAALAGEVGE